MAVMLHIKWLDFAHKKLNDKILSVPEFSEEFYRILLVSKVLFLIADLTVQTSHKLIYTAQQHFLVYFHKFRISNPRKFNTNSITV